MSVEPRFRRVLLYDENANQVDASNPLNVSLSAGTVYVIPPNTFTSLYTGNQTNVTMITPTAGKKLQIIGVLATSEDALFEIIIEFLTSGKIVMKHFESATLGSYIPCNISGNTDEVLSLNITGSAGKEWFVQVNYAEVD